MAGPTASVLAAFESSPPEFQSLLKDYACDWHDPCSFAVDDTRRFGGNFIGEPRPFVGGFEPFIFDPDEWPDDAATSSAISDATGRDFTHYIVVSAMCNQPVDHQILCEIVSALSNDMNGIVDFDCINAPDDAKLLLVEWSFEGRPQHTYVGSGDDARRWLDHSAFRMCK